MPHIRVDSGIEWHYKIEGSGKETLLFLHGWGVDKRIWHQQVRHFAEKYRVVTVDLPGHGQSSWLKINLNSMVHDLRAILECKKINKVTIISSSLGGLFALKLYQAFSQGIQKLSFVGSLPKFARSKDYPYGLNVAQIRRLDNQLKIAYPSIVNIFFRSLFTKEERENRRFKWLERFRQKDELPLKEALREYLDILEHEDLRDILKKVEAPIQFINGTNDTICHVRFVDHLKKLVPYARFDYFKNCGHFPFLSKPHEFNKVLEEFLASKTASPKSNLKSAHQV